MQKHNSNSTISSRMLMFLINDILDLGTIQQNTFQFNYSEFEVGEITKVVRDMFTKDCQMRGIQLTLPMQQSLLSKVVKSDLRRIQQILLNLMSNAVKHTKRYGQVDIHMYLHPNQDLEFEVIDTGCGIPINKQKKLFKFFGVSEDKEAYSTASVGLGLTISQALVQKFGGKISLKSKVDFGTRISFTIPCKQVIQTSEIPFCRDTLNDDSSPTYQQKYKPLCPKVSGFHSSRLMLEK